MSYIINTEKFYQNRMPGVGQPCWVSDGPVGIPDFDQRLCTWLMSLSRSSECSLTTHVLIIHILRRQSCFSLLLPAIPACRSSPLPQGSRLWKIAGFQQKAQGGSVVMLKKAASPQRTPWPFLHESVYPGN